jgi:hypothetical protein
MNQVSLMTKGMANTIAYNLTDLIVIDEMQELALDEAKNILNKVQ